MTLGVGDALQWGWKKDITIKSYKISRQYTVVQYTHLGENIVKLSFKNLFLIIRFFVLFINENKGGGA